MTETVIVALIGVGGTLLGAFGGGHLANRHANKQLDARRQFEVHDAARSIVVTTLVAARAWRAAASGASMVVAAGEDRSVIDKYMRDDFFDSYSGQQIREHGAAFDRAVTEAKLLISNAPLREEIDSLQQLQTGWWGQVLDPSFELRKEGADKVERLRPWIRFNARFDRALAQVEATASRSIASQL
ncbi:hypothetical protein GCM10010915_11970 [Microbacterium faecale]|uniref:Uncharacterized protein n=1 Tax=Microbacterium faecale TaxID=1804630 RepID=A0A917DFD9_9MICO|nr:hypothetical protein [Microbacterium faecale]GGD33177.1 hypothetical protein GCM10010915_11970 [Microbacterium faecale]